MYTFQLNPCTVSDIELFQLHYCVTFLSVAL